MSSTFPHIIFMTSLVLQHLPYLVAVLDLVLHQRSLITITMPTIITLQVVVEQMETIILIVEALGGYQGFISRDHLPTNAAGEH